MDFDLQNTGQSHYFDENVKWSYGHYGHFAAGCRQNHNKTCVFDKSVEIHSSLDQHRVPVLLGGVNRLKPEYYWGGLTPQHYYWGGLTPPRFKPALLLLLGGVNPPQVFGIVFQGSLLYMSATAKTLLFCSRISDSSLTSNLLKAVYLRTLSGTK